MGTTRKWRAGSLLLSLSLLLPGFSAAPAPVTEPAPAGVPSPAHADGVVLVKFQPGAGAAERAQARRSAGAVSSEPLSPLAVDTEKLTLGPGVAVDRAIQGLSRNPNVVYAEPDYVVTHQAISDDLYYTNGSLWGMYGDATPIVNQYGSQAGEAWTAGHTGSSTVYVGVIDEGIQFTHPDLALNVWTNPFDDPTDSIDNDGNGYVNDVHGWDFFSSDNTIYDGTGDDHGTHVAGTIGAKGGNGAGVAGVNWNVTLISAKFLGPNGGYISDAVKAADYLTDLKTRHRLNIVASSNSWGGGGFSQSLLAAINRGGDAGILFIAAAGNANSNNDTTASYPSNYQCDNGGTRGWDCVIAVASITSTGARSSFSSYGAATVDLGAPGSGIYSTVPTGSYANYSGTSMATPHVSGAAALCASITPTLTAQQIKAAILSTTVPTTSLSGITVIGGRLNVERMATECAPAAPDTQAPSAPSGLAPTQVTSSSVQLTWAPATDDVAVAAYDVYWSNGSLLGTTSGLTYTDAGLAPSTAYNYHVKARDASGKVSPSAQTSATTLAAPVMRVSGVDVTVSRSPNRKTRTATATVTVVDAVSGAPVPSATVTGRFTLNDTTDLGGAKSGATSSSGSVVLKSSSTSGSGTFSFCVTNVTHTSYVWDRVALCDTAFSG